MLQTINPTTGEPLETYEEHGRDEIDRRLAKAAAAYPAWRERSFDERAAVLRAAAQALTDRSAALSRLMTLEMGKPIEASAAEVDKCAWVCRYYADHAADYLARRDVATDATRSYVRFDPLGPVLAIMPWNFPYWQVFRCAAPALMAGNAVVLKHAETVQGCAEALRDLLLRAGLPEGLFSVLRVGVGDIPALIEHPSIRVASFTGSTRAGKIVAAAAGAALKRTVLELGGSDAYVVLSDADVDRAAEACVAGRLLNTGQSCIAAKRFVVSQAVLSSFTERVVESFRNKRWGSPLADESVDLGPLARRDLRDSLHAQVRSSVDSGAKLLLGGAVPDDPGFFYPPTVLGDVHRGAAAYHEETFGPVAAILPAKNDEEAIAIANDTSYGLGAAVFTRDPERGEAIARERLEAGSCFVNDFVRSDPRLPFGGVKESGWGRELSVFGIREFVYPKTVAVAP